MHNQTYQRLPFQRMLNVPSFTSSNMALLNQKAFERKLQNMSSAQDSVQTVSLWMIHHKKNASDMATVWFDQLRRASKADRRLVLFYLVNDVLQNSRKKGKEFSNAFTKILKEAMVLLSESSIKGSVERVIKIWEERKLFEKEYLEALRNKLASGDIAIISKKVKEKAIEKEKEKEVKSPKQKRLPPADFKPSKLIDALKALRDFEGELTLKESQLNSLRIDASDLESVRQLKDRTGGGKFCEEYELATSKLQEFSETLRREQEERKNLIKVLEDGGAFFDVAYGEVKVIVHAYKTFGNRLTSLKKKVDGKMNRLAQKEAEKAKTRPVTAPQSSFLTSGLPEVAEGSAPSTPTEGKKGSNKSPEEEKPIDPTVDNIEVADMEIEDDSDSEKSETSEEASADDAKGSNVQTPNSTESSDSQPAKSTPQDSTPSISPVVSVAPAQPLTPNLGTVMPLRGSMLPHQPQLGPPGPAPVGVVIRPFMGVQGARFPAPAPQFRPGGPPIRPSPSMTQNQLMQPSGPLPGTGHAIRQEQPFPQLSGQTVLLPRANAQLPGNMGSLQPLGSGFVHSQAPLPVAAPLQVMTGSVPGTQIHQVIEGLSQAGGTIGSPDSEASAPSPVGSPELHLVEGDETPETTPAPLGDVDVKDNTGFQTNKSFFENAISNSGPGLSGAQPTAKAFVPAIVSESSSSSSTPSVADQLGGQDAALAKKDNGQKVSAVDILAQLLSRGRQMQQQFDVEVNCTTVAPTVVSAPLAPSAPSAPSVAPQQNSDTPQSKPLLSLIDSLFPKLSDSIKTLKQKEQSGSSPQSSFDPPVDNNPKGVPSWPAPTEGQFQPLSKIRPEQAPPQRSEPQIIAKRGPQSNEEFRGESLSNFSEERPIGGPMEMPPESGGNTGLGARHDHVDSQPPEAREATRAGNFPRPGPPFLGPSVRGGSPRFPQERPFDRPGNLSPRGIPPFGPRAPFPQARGPQFEQGRDSAGPPVQRRDGQPEMSGRVPPDQVPQGHSPRGSFETTSIPPEHRQEHRPHGIPREEGFSNGPRMVKRLSTEGAPIHRPDSRRSPHEQIPRGDAPPPPPHRVSHSGMMNDVERRREFERWEEHRREPFRDHGRGPWEFPHDHPGHPPPGWRGPPVSPHGDPNRVDFREDDPSLWTSFEGPGRSPRSREGFREGPPEFNRFHGYGPPDRRRHSLGDFESERMRPPLKRPGPPPVPFSGPSKRPFY